MKKNMLFMMLFLIVLAFSSCGPVVVTSRLNHPPPPWFYPDRLELVRYVYFPEYSIYYDLTLSNYLYQNNGVWVRVNVLPTQYDNINLNRARFIRVKGYRADNIRQYHNEINIRRGTRTTRRNAKSSGRRSTNRSIITKKRQK